jgi:hypothetical protein
MAIYTVLAPAARGDEARPDPFGTVFVKDGFCWPALFIPLLWLIYRRMWLVLVLYLAAAAALTLAFRGTGGDGDFGGLILLALHVLFALEANNLRRWTLERNGYRMVGLAEGRNLEEAEVRFFSRAEAPDPLVTVPSLPPIPPTPPLPPTPTRMGPMPPSAEAGDVVGLFPAPPPTPRGSPS